MEQRKVQSTLLTWLREEKTKWHDNLDAKELDAVVQLVQHQPNIYEFVNGYGWIIKTMQDRKQYWKLRKAKRILFVGAGFYPYSMIGLQYQFPEVKVLGLEINPIKVKVANALFKFFDIHHTLRVIEADGLAFDYSKLSDEDLVFITSDIDDNNLIAQKILLNSEAEPIICAPYKNAWLNTYKKRGS